MAKIAKLFSTMLLGSYVSFYLAILNNIDPTPVLKVEMLKKELEQ